MAVSSVCCLLRSSTCNDVWGVCSSQTILSGGGSPLHCAEKRLLWKAEASLSLRLSLMLRPTVSRPVCFGIKHPSWAYDQIFITVRQLRVCWYGAFSLWREDGPVVYNCWWSSQAQSFLGPSPVVLVTIFYCLRFETSLFVASYDSQEYGGGIRPCLHTGLNIPISKTCKYLRENI
jgi:hypothetical protein